MQPRKRKVPTKGSRSVANRHEDPRFARLCDEWFVVTGSKLSWADLAREAHDFVAAVPRQAR